MVKFLGPFSLLIQSLSVSVLQFNLASLFLASFHFKAFLYLSSSTFINTFLFFISWFCKLDFETLSDSCMHRMLVCQVQLLLKYTILLLKNQYFLHLHLYNKKEIGWTWKYKYLHCIQPVWYRYASFKVQLYLSWGPPSLLISKIHPNSRISKI